MFAHWLGVLALLLLASRAAVTSLLAIISVYSRRASRRRAAYRVVCALTSRRSCPDCRRRVSGTLFPWRRD